MVRFVPSLEGAQHSGKGLEGFLKFGKKVGCVGVQPSNFMVTKADGSLMTAAEVRTAFEAAELQLHGLSAHCPFWCHGANWTGTKGIIPFLPPAVMQMAQDQRQLWTETYLLKFVDLTAELGLKLLAMFWGPYWGLEVASGYPWGMWSGPGYDLIAEGDERFLKMTAKIRQHAAAAGIVLAHEIHPGTGVLCADDFQHLVEITDGDACVGVNADPSHCWENEDYDVRFRHPFVAPRIAGNHVKDMKVIPGRNLRSMAADWHERGMQFTRLGEGQINLVDYMEILIESGFAGRYAAAHGTDDVPLVGEAESALYELDDTAAHATKFIAENLCRGPIATESFEKKMGQK